MNSILNQHQVHAVDQLIRKEATGTPKMLGKKLNMKEKEVLSFIQTLRDEYGYPIGYSKADKTYYYFEEW